MNAPSIVTRPLPPAAAGAQATFVPSKFDELIVQQGGRVYHERALRCPCAAGNVGGAQLTACQNCGGQGWIFINKVETRMAIQHQNLKISFEAGAERVLGDAAVSARAQDRLCRMDRITEPDAESTHNQLMQFRLRNQAGRWFCYTTYPLKQALELFLFQAPTAPLVRLVEGTDFTVGDQRIELSAEFDDLEEITVSATYVHMPQYYVVELTRGTVTVNARKGSAGEKGAAKMPLSALIRKAEYVLDQNGYTGERMLDNSYLTACNLEK